ncbi:MAG: T9SS type A sorting domain-containing protein [Flavobacterium sp.]
MKQLRTIAFLLLLLASSYSYSQSGVVVTYYDGTTQGFSVAATGKLYFSNDNLNVKTDGSATAVISIPVNIIRKITFTDSTLGTPGFGENKNNLALYPNPGSETLQIKSDLFEDLDVKIYSLTGQLVKQGSYTPNQSIDVSALSSGLYLVQVNGLTLKFSKK